MPIQEKDFDEYDLHQRTRIKVLERLLLNILNSASPQHEYEFSYLTSSTWIVKNKALREARLYFDDYENNFGKDARAAAVISYKYEVDNPYCDLPVIYNLKVGSTKMPGYFKELIVPGRAVGYTLT